MLLPARRWRSGRVLQKAFGIMRGTSAPGGLASNRKFEIDERRMEPPNYAEYADLCVFQGFVSVHGMPQKS
jgi:hypothetical protein